LWQLAHECSAALAICCVNACASQQCSNWGSGLLQVWLLLLLPLCSRLHKTPDQLESSVSPHAAHLADTRLPQHCSRRMEQTATPCTCCATDHHSTHWFQK
jgi:hypothetical protein